MIWKSGRWNAKGRGSRKTVKRLEKKLVEICYSQLQECYVHTPEYEETLAVWKDGEQEWEVFWETLSESQRTEAEELKECMEDCICSGKESIYTKICGLCAGSVS